ncbi:MAG: bile acid:sodium symporter family protein [Acidiphilium sp.]
MYYAGFVINKMMPFWLIVAAMLAYWMPGTFHVLAPYSVYFLGGVILLMSLTIDLPALAQVFTRPKALIAGFVIKWITVPLAAVIAAHLVFSSQPQLAAGTILDGSTPAGVSSNLFTFLAHGAVALAVSLTFIHTILSPLLTPMFTATLAGKYVAVSFFALMTQMIKLVLLPVFLGIAVRYALGPRRIVLVTPFLPMLSAIFLYCIALGLVAQAEPAIAKNLDWVPIIGVTTSALTCINLAVAYILAKALRLEEASARAIMFDVGVYNSGLGAVLAYTNFGPFAALPALMNSVLNMIIGSILATYLMQRPIPEAPENARFAAASGMQVED